VGTSNTDIYHSVLFWESDNATITLNVSQRAVDRIYIKGRASSSPVATPGAATVNVLSTTEVGSHHSLTSYVY